MKAWVLHDINDIRFEEVNNPTISSDEVLVKVRAAGICGSDIPRIYRDGAHNMPLIPGHEFSGEVIEVGAQVDKSWMGKRVGAFPLIPCKKCISCKNMQYEMCSSYSYLGSRRDGAYAEYVTIPEWNLIELPGNISFEEAAMLEPMAVAVHAMRRIIDADIQRDIRRENKSVIVYGLGTIGLMLTMFLIDAGIERLFVVGNKQSQFEMINKMGIPKENYCDSKKINVKAWISEKTEGHGIDIGFECVGRQETVADVIEISAPTGKVMLIGNPYSDMTLDKNIYWKILRNQLTVLGTWNSSYTHDVKDDWHYVLERLQKRRITPEMFISHIYELSELERGFHIMRDKSDEYIKEMVVNQKPFDVV